MGDTFTIRDLSGVTRLAGTLHLPDTVTPGDALTVESDGSIVATPGATPASESLYAGDLVAVLNAATTSLTWDTLVSADDLLDRSVPDAPTFIAAGTYAVAVVVTGDALTAAGYAVARIVAQATALASGYTQAPEDGWGAAGTLIAEAGDVLVVEVLNADGVATRSYAIAAATLVKL